MAGPDDSEGAGGGFGLAASSEIDRGLAGSLEISFRGPAGSDTEPGIGSLGSMRGSASSMLRLMECKCACQRPSVGI